MTQHTEYFVCDVRREWTNPARYPFVTFWGPKNCGYVYSLAAAGRYTREDLDPGYHYKNAASASSFGARVNAASPGGIND